MRKRLDRIFLIKVFLITAIFCQAQKVRVSGAVHDKLSRQPLANAIIEVRSITDTSYSVSLLSNQKGSYQFSASTGIYQLEIRYLGYKTYQDTFNIEASSHGIGITYLVLDQKDLATVTIQARKPYITITSSKITLNVAQSLVAAGNTTYDIIKKAPGVMELGDQFSFRGKSITVYINDRPSNLSGEELKNMLVNLPAGSVDRIEILPSPSAKYEAQGGTIINVVMAKNKNFGTNYILTANAGAGIYARTSSGLDINHRGKDLVLTAGYNFSVNHQYFRQQSTRYLPGARILSEEYDLRKRINHFYKLGLDYDLSKRSSIGLFINGFINDRGREVTNRSLLHYNTAVDDSVNTVHTTGNAQFIRNAVNLYYKTILDSTGKELSLNADFMDYRKQWNDQFINQYFDQTGSEFRPADFIRDYSPGNINVYSLAADYSHPTPRGRWEMGIKTNYTITDNNIKWENNEGAGWYTDNGKTNHFRYRENVNAVYLNNTLSHNKWSVQSGIRLEQTNTAGYSITLDKANRKRYLNLFPNLGIQYTANAKSQLGLNYRKSIQRFGFSYVNPFIVYQNRYAYSQGNPGIQPEIYHNVEINYTYKQSFNASFNYVHGINTLGEIYLQGPNNVTISSYGNYKGSDLFYLSLSANAALTKWWGVSFNPMAGYVSMNNESNGLATGSRKNALVTQIVWNNTYTFRKGLMVEWSMFFISPFEYGSYQRKTQFNTDLGVSKNILKGKVNLKLNISDVLNTCNNDREINYDEVKTSVKIKSESRFINLTARYKFGNKNVKGKSRAESKISELQSRI